ncbi:hypothetical protein BE08_42950 [Sorangium cellulosum]|uniref:Uncharacterized protein n=1 Tax=Sorangium cellulosum TaxID=56 RepID=A0A150PCI9_SORCE|nr:hypothetical protein BE08_42950 [Sorangium cellulosum]
MTLDVLASRGARAAARSTSDNAAARRAPRRFTGFGRGCVLGLVLSALAPALSGCIPFGDPEGPGASGVVSLGDGVSTSGLTTLRVRAIPASGEPFDEDDPQFTGPAFAAEDGWLTVNERLDGLTFPHPYEVGDVVGTTDKQRWRLFAWLSAADVDVDSDAPSSGEPYGTITFDVDECGSGFDGYCTVTKGVNVTIDKVAP